MGVDLVMIPLVWCKLEDVRVHQILGHCLSTSHGSQLDVFCQIYLTLGKANDLACLFDHRSTFSKEYQEGRYGNSPLRLHNSILITSLAE